MEQIVKFTQADADMLMSEGKKMAKKRNPVYLYGPLNYTSSVETNEVILNAKIGDYVAHDPISGHVWPIAADYVEMHYESF